MLTGGVGDDTLQGEGGLDTLNGGVSTAVGDTASYAERTTPVSVTLPGGLAGEDTFTGIENVTGGGGDDTLTGDGGANKLLGGSGDDTLQGAGGIDALDGGDEGAVGDTASFAERNTGVTAFSATGMVGEDTFTEIENLTGSGGGDTSSATARRTGCAAAMAPTTWTATPGSTSSRAATAPTPCRVGRTRATRSSAAATPRSTRCATTAPGRRS